MTRPGRFVGLGLAALFLLLPVPSSHGGQAGEVDRLVGVTWRESLRPDGLELDGESTQAGLSADKRYLVFWTRAANLHPADADSRPDVYRRDLWTGAIELVSVNPAGISGNGYATSPGISGDGRLVTFASYANDLIPGDQNGYVDVFLRDMEAGTTIRVSEDGSGQGGDHHSVGPTISMDGRFVSFISYASNLVPDDGNKHFDVFVYEVETGMLELITRGYDGKPANNHSSGRAYMSADGRFLVFDSIADNLVPDDAKETWDVFLHDRQTGLSRQLSRPLDGSTSDGELLDGRAISANGRWAAFSSPASNLVPDDEAGWSDIFLYDLESGQRTRVTRGFDGDEANGSSVLPSLSGDGRYLSYTSGANNLVPGDANGRSDVFVFDRLTGETRLISLSSLGDQGEGWSDFSTLSLDGRLVVFTSEAANLVPGDENGLPDLFLHDRFLTERIFFPLVRPFRP